MIHDHINVDFGFVCLISHFSISCVGAQFDAGLLFLLVAWLIDKIWDWMLLDAVALSSQLSIGNCYLLFTSTIYHNRQNYCLHLSFLGFGSQLSSKQKHFSQFSFALEKHNLENQYMDISNRKHSSPLSQEDFNCNFGVTWRMARGMDKATSLETLATSFGLQLTIAWASSHKNQQECCISLCEGLEEITLPVRTHNLCNALVRRAGICGALKGLWK